VSSGQQLTGERLDASHGLYAADLARHRAAYDFAASRVGAGRVLDLGCGTGYGSAELARTGARVTGLDRVAAARESRGSGARFVRGELGGLPFAPASFDVVLSFQVIEHLLDPTDYLREITRVLRPSGTLLLSTPNLLQSDRENPYHVHEYAAQELEAALSRWFGAVEMLGVFAFGPAARFQAERMRRIRRITRLDPLGLRRRLPRGLVEWLFARLSLLVRIGAKRGGAVEPVGVEHFRIAPVDLACLDLLAVCRAPRPAA
jgi:2-polyprenyl-3-methyl-5-hydroxy-6-metoxy-1,4-benzoquinol methylase